MVEHIFNPSIPALEADKSLWFKKSLVYKESLVDVGLQRNCDHFGRDGVWEEIINKISIKIPTQFFTKLERTVLNLYGKKQQQQQQQPQPKKKTQVS